MTREQLEQALTDELMARAWQAYYCPNPTTDGRYPASAAAMRAVLVSALLEAQQPPVLAKCDTCGRRASIEHVTCPWLGCEGGTLKEEPR